MKPALAGKPPDALCRSIYVSTARASRKRGLEFSVIEKSAKELCYRVGGRYYLKANAFKPTGIALGCPLPDFRLARRLWRIAQLAAKCLSSIACDGGKTFAFIPKDFYHITLVNRTHYEVNQTITMMTQADKDAAQNLMDQLGGGPLTVHLNGLILTTGGKLIVPGFPGDDRLYEIRKRLAETLPQLSVRLPLMAHIKLGHVITPIESNDLQKFLTNIAILGTHISARLDFHDAYTDTGRVAF